jgi:LmbE family N-acetylglucosaminyl deacetylase
MRCLLRFFRERTSISSLVLALSLVLGTLAPPTARADYLVIAPHPDDELLIAAGVIYRARQAGITVWVMLTTNGDVTGIPSGIVRQGESIDGLALLGVDEDHTVFLGYADGSLQPMRNNFVSMPYTSPNTASSQTQGTRGLGRAPYNRTRTGTGTNGPNMGNAVKADLEHFLNARRPTDIFVTGPLDEHPDHATSYLFLRDALEGLATSLPSYNPTVHQTVIWHYKWEWPLPQDPTAYHTPTICQRGTPDEYKCLPPWEERESLDVPLEMQIADVDPAASTNLKIRALEAHVSQGGFMPITVRHMNDGRLAASIHKDEFFWTARASGADQPPVPNAGLDQMVDPGQSVTLDATGSFDPDETALTYAWRQVAGPDVTLSAADEAQPTFKAPDSPDETTTLAFELRVSDDVSTSVADAVSVLVSAGVAEPDPGEEDAGAPDDGGSEDDGETEGDAGARADAGGSGSSSRDAGEEDDPGEDDERDAGGSGAGSDDAPEKKSEKGCTLVGVGPGGWNTSAASLLLAAVVLTVRRRRANGRPRRSLR